MSSESSKSLSPLQSLWQRQPLRLSSRLHPWASRLLLISLLLGSGGMGWQVWSTARSRQTQAEFNTQSIARKTVPVTITANGTVQPERSINLSPKSAGVVQSLWVKEGDRVRQGQVIATMDASNLRGQLTQMQGQLSQQEANLQRLVAGNRPEDIARAEAQLAEAEAALQALRSGNRPQEIAQAAARLQQAQATLRLRTEDWQRYQSLYAQGAIARQTLDQKQADRDVAQMQVVEAEQALALQRAGARQEEIDQAAARVEQQRQSVAALKSGNRREDIGQARAQVQAARGALQNIQAQIDDTQITAPFDGIVTKKYADVGSFVSPSMAGGGGESASSSSILTLATQNQIVANVSESQISQIQLGQAVEIQADAFLDQTFTGKVTQIAAQATVSQNVTSFEVRVSIDHAATSSLKSGMNVEIQFAVSQLDDALLVPNAAVVRTAEGTGVYVLGGDRQPTFQPIETGITTGDQTEVKAGLEGNEQILLDRPPQQPRSQGFGLPGQNPSQNP